KWKHEAMLTVTSPSGRRTHSTSPTRHATSQNQKAGVGGTVHEAKMARAASITALPTSTSERGGLGLMIRLPAGLSFNEIGDTVDREVHQRRGYGAVGEIHRDAAHGPPHVGLRIEPERAAVLEIHIGRARAIGGEQ